jgi:hypothetical protein
MTARQIAADANKADLGRGHQHQQREGAERGEDQEDGHGGSRANLYIVKIPKGEAGVVKQNLYSVKISCMTIILAIISAI